MWGVLRCGIINQPITAPKRNWRQRAPQKDLW